MNRRRITDWLESHWVAPALGGWLLLGLSIFFFGAATNTMAGWLYVISGVMAALLAIAAILPGRSLHKLCGSRSPIRPIHVGQPFTVEIVIENRHASSLSLVQLQDVLPSALGKPMLHSVELIPAYDSYHWRYEFFASRRGIYQWQTLLARTAAPFGLFWRRRHLNVPTKAVVYPTVLTLTQCPLVAIYTDNVNTQVPRLVNARQASDGLTRAMRPYRWGDPFRLIHWRTSARYGELRVRELESFTTGQAMIIGLDSSSTWHPDWFEQAVIAAASLYVYASHQKLQVSLWTAKTGLLQGFQTVLEALSDTQAQEQKRGDRLPQTPVIWLTQDLNSIQKLSPGSLWLGWPNDIREGDRRSPSDANLACGKGGKLIDPMQPLQNQLQSPIDIDTVG